MRFQIRNSNVNKIIEADSAQEAMFKFAIENPEHVKDTVLVKLLDDSEEE